MSAATNKEGASEELIAIDPFKSIKMNASNIINLFI